jgi:hypothetical protein
MAVTLEVREESNLFYQAFPVFPTAKAREIGADSPQGAVRIGKP